MGEGVKPVWKMTKTELVDEIDERLRAKGSYVAFPSRAARIKLYGKTELENECASLREEVSV